MAQNSLKKKAIHGVIWSSIERFGYQFIQFFVLIILARLLLPKDFGLIGMLLIFLAISNTIINSGFGAALIQKQETTNVDYSTVFFFNILLGIILYAILFLTAPLIADFYDEQRLTGIIRFVGIILIFNSFGILPTTILTKRVDFKTTSFASIISVVISGIIAIIMALKGYGVWSLAVQMVFSALIKNLLLLILTKWKPLFVFNYRSLKGLFAFGSRLLISSIIDQLFQNIYLLIIGKLFTSQELGYYTQAKKIQELPVINLSTIIGSVTFPVFSSIQNENQRLKEGYKKTIKALVFINFPLMAGLFVIAEPLVKFLLTDKWLPSVIFIQLLCISGFIFTLQSTNLNILKVKGRSDLFLRLEIIKKILIVFSIIIGLKWGIIGLLWARVINSYLAYFINSFYSGKLINYPVKEQLSDIYPYMISAILMAFVLFLIASYIHLNYVAILIIQITVGIMIYYLITKAFHLEALLEIISIANNKLNLRTRK